MEIKVPLQEKLQVSEKDKLFLLAYDFITLIHDEATEELKNNKLGFALLPKFDPTTQNEAIFKGIILMYEEHLRRLLESSTAYLERWETLLQRRVRTEHKNLSEEK